MSTQAFVFIGEGYYPQKHLEDLWVTLPHVPDLAEMVSIAKDRAEKIFKAGGLDETEWAAILVVPVNAPPEQKYYKFRAGGTKEEVEAAGFTHVLEVSDGETRWLGIQELVRTKTRYENGHVISTYSDYSPKE